ncbi:MAG: DUF5677 domain-containing protein [Desulfobacteraceae bacterium]|jgi:hypothetical protein|nr:DUF5677 domain-containing protein [Desulfobacteraceae bacterium]
MTKDNDIVQIISEKYKDIFNLSNEMIGSAPAVVVGQNANTLPKQIALFHYARSIYLLDAIARLCIEGFANEAMIILRSFLNLFINLKWVTSDNYKYRMERFADFEVVQKKLAIEKIIKYGSIPNQIGDTEVSPHDEAFEKVKAKYGLKTYWDLTNWSGKSIRKMAKEVCLENDYHIIYGKLSEIEHTGPASVRDYLDDSEEGITSVKIGGRDKDIDLVMLTSLEFYAGVKAITLNVFDMDWDSFEEQRQKVSTLKTKYWNN